MMKDQPEQIFETDWIDYSEEVKDKFLVIEFIDQTNTHHHLEISSDEINFKYGEQKVHMTLQNREKGLFKNPVKDIFFDWYLKSVFMSKEVIKFNYDILVDDQIITSNAVVIETKNI